MFINVSNTPSRRVYIQLSLYSVYALTLRLPAWRVAWRNHATRSRSPWRGAHTAPRQRPVMSHDLLYETGARELTCHARRGTTLITEPNTGAPRRLPQNSIIILSRAASPLCRCAGLRRTSGTRPPRESRPSAQAARRAPRLLHQRH